MIPTESRVGTYTKRENITVAKKQSVPNLLSGANSTFKAQKQAGPSNIPMNTKVAQSYHHSNSVNSMMSHPAAQA